MPCRRNVLLKLILTFLEFLSYRASKDDVLFSLIERCWPKLESDVFIVGLSSAYLGLVLCLIETAYAFVMLFCFQILLVDTCQSSERLQRLVLTYVSTSFR